MSVKLPLFSDFVAVSSVEWSSLTPSATSSADSSAMMLSTLALLSKISESALSTSLSPLFKFSDVAIAFALVLEISFTFAFWSAIALVEFSIIVSWALTAAASVFTVAIAVSASPAFITEAVTTVPRSVVLSLSTSAAVNFLPAFSTGTPASIAFLSASFLSSSLPVAAVVSSVFAAVTASACFAMLVASVPFRATLSLSAPVCKAFTLFASSFSFSAFAFSFAATSFFRALLSAS